MYLFSKIRFHLFLFLFICFSCSQVFAGISDSYIEKITTDKTSYVAGDTAEIKVYVRNPDATSHSYWITLDVKDKNGSYLINHELGNGTKSISTAYSYFSITYNLNITASFVIGQCTTEAGLRDRENFSSWYDAGNWIHGINGPNFYILEPPKPDLQVSTSSSYTKLDKTIIFPRDSLRADARVVNSGDGSSESSYLYYYLSSNTTASSSEYIDDDYVPSLSPNDYSDEYDTFTTFSDETSLDDSDYGTWYVIFKADADNDVSESNENNNQEAVSVTITRPTLSNYTCNSTEVAPGETIYFNYYINNPLSESRQIGLGASIRKQGTSDWLENEDNDTKVTVSSGTHWYSRPFKVPEDVETGTYDLAWGFTMTRHLLQHLCMITKKGREIYQY